MSSLHYFNAKLMMWLEKWLQTNSRFKIGLIFAVSLLLFSFPDLLTLYKNCAEYEIYRLVDHQIDLPFSPLDYPSESHYAKRTFRLTMPFIAKLTHISSVGLFYLQCVFGLCFFWVLFKLSQRHTDDRVLSFLFTLGVTFIYIGKSFFTDYSLFFDGSAFFFLLLAMYFRNPILAFLFLSLAFWTDERAIVASLSVVVYRMFFMKNKKSSHWLLEGWQHLVLLFLVLAINTSIRLFLQHEFGMTPSIGGIGLFIIIFNYYPFMPLSIFMFLEAYWLYIIMGVFFVCRSKIKTDLLPSVLFVFGILIQCYVALIVADMVRSGAYLVVPCLTSFYLLCSDENEKSILKVPVLWITMVAFLIPTYCVYGWNVVWIKPGLNSLFKLFLN